MKDYKIYGFTYKGKKYCVIEQPYIPFKGEDGFRYTDNGIIHIYLKSGLAPRAKQLLLHRLIKLRGVKEHKVKNYY